MHRSIKLVFACFGIALAGLASAYPARESRAAFAQAMSQLKEGSTEAEVRAILGPPDDILKPSDALNGFDRRERTIGCHASNV